MLAMSLMKLSLPVADEKRARTLAAFLGELEPAAHAVALFRDETTAGWQLDAYCEPGDLPAIVEALGRVAPHEVKRLSTEPVADANWVAVSQAALAPIAAGRFLVHGSHDRAAAAGRWRRAIEIDAGEAFGTAQHASTRGCLLALDWLMRRRPFRCVLDLGCGTGVLGIAAARLEPAARIVASDIDPRAVVVARANARLNGVAGRVHVVAAAGLDHPALRGMAQRDLVLANILAEPLIALAPEIRASLKPDGHVVLAGLLDSEARQVAAAYRATGFVYVRKHCLAGWATLTLRRC
jgi:ribosomal protein L11 methyltransferase